MPISTRNEIVFNSEESAQLYWSFINHNIRACSYIEEFMYPIECWPILIIETILNKDFSYRGRVRLSTFFYINGVSPYVVIKFLKLYGLNLTHSATFKFYGLYVYYITPGIVGDSIRSRYFGYDCFHKRLMYLNGDECILGNCVHLLPTLSQC